MTSFLRASAGLNRSWLCILAVAACLGWVQACTDPQDGVPEAWNSYEHNRDRKLSSDCAERPNFAFEVPSSWKLGEADCDSISFEAENDPAELRVVVLDLPDYPQNVEAALDRMQYRWSREENVAEDSVKRVEHHGSPAISRVHTEPGSPAWSCESHVYALATERMRGGWIRKGREAWVMVQCPDAAGFERVRVETAMPGGC